MEESKKTSDSYFQMPLHYPRYTRKEYQNMPEWQLDRLLAEYGLPAATATVDLATKREFAMGAFLWPEFHDMDQPDSANSSPHHCYSSSTCTAKSKVVQLLFRVLGFA